MNWTDKQLGFILYNNRSVEGVVSNFLHKNIDPVKVIEIENKLDWVKSIYEYDTQFVEVNKSELNLDSEDIIVTKDNIESLTKKIKESIGKFSNNEKEYLYLRGIGNDVIQMWNLCGLSQITDYQDLVYLNATCHPILNKILNDGLDAGGIIIPLYEEGKLINCAIRKIGIESDGYSRTLKYSLACPDLFVWGLDDINHSDEIWICEGLFDMMALRQLGLKAVSVSSAIWSGPQLYQLLEKKPGLINILCDKDQVGLRCGAILKRFFNLHLIPNQTWICKSGKDASEIIFEKNLNLSDIEEIKITSTMINRKDESFDFLKHLKNRKI